MEREIYIYIYAAALVPPPSAAPPLEVHPVSVTEEIISIIIRGIIICIITINTMNYYYYSVDRER